MRILRQGHSKCLSSTATWRCPSHKLQLLREVRDRQEQQQQHSRSLAAVCVAPSKGCHHSSSSSKAGLLQEGRWSRLSRMLLLGWQTQPLQQQSLGLSLLSRGCSSMG
jgi:hypothetical protein